MIYGQRPEGIGDDEWTLECQHRHVAREMKKGRHKAARLAIFELWKQRLPGVSKDRVAEIWREGVPMPGKGQK